MITAQLKQALDFVARQGRKLFGSPRQDAPAGSIETLALDLLSERGEATSMARADAIVRLYASLSKEQRELFHLFLALNLLARDDTAEGGGEGLSERTHARDRARSWRSHPSRRAGS